MVKFNFFLKNKLFTGVVNVELNLRKEEMNFKKNQRTMVERFDEK